MDYKNIIFNLKENTAIIHLNRSEVLNSFNYEMADELLSALEECKKMAT